VGPQTMLRMIHFDTKNPKNVLHVFKSAILFLILNPAYEMCFKLIKPMVRQPTNQEVLYTFNQLSLHAQHNKQHNSTHKKPTP
jgi:hypothetical protein